MSIRTGLPAGNSELGLYPELHGRYLFGSMLRLFREHFKLSQEDLAELLDMSRQAISFYESFYSLPENPHAFLEKFQTVLKTIRR